jgi:hypothetical protein
METCPKVAMVYRLMNKSKDQRFFFFCRQVVKIRHKKNPFLWKKNILVCDWLSRVSRIWSYTFLLLHVTLSITWVDKVLCTRFLFLSKGRISNCCSKCQNFLQKLSKMLLCVELGGCKLSNLRELCETSLPIRISIANDHILFIVWTIVKEPTYHQYNKDSTHHMC